MSSGRKCKNCGSSDIEVDPGRGDAVCTNCGSVLEDNIIVAEIQFEENAHGASSAIGQFVSADSKGGATNFGASFHVGMGVESREVTLRKARQGISALCNQLRLNQHCIDTACNFFKMALSRHLTRGRKNTHVHAACVYITCRTEGTAHLLIDISDVLQICCYELGRTYLRLSQALCINIPSVDPCLYILRFAAKLEFGDKMQEVANTALRLVQRMKRDSIHSGRRPSGLCGAALLMAARLHDYNRKTTDIVKIVKVHESTLRKRLIEFGDTPSSALTLEEFMSVDLEEEQDPPSFKAARKKDKERLQKLMEEEADTLTELQVEIECQLLKDGKNRKKPTKSGAVVTAHPGNVEQELQDEVRFIEQSTVGTIEQILEDERADDPDARDDVPKELGPNIASMGLAKSMDDQVNTQLNTPAVEEDTEVLLDDLDDEELDAYIMNENERCHKGNLWNKLNATYLQEQKDKEERLAKEKEEGKPEKKKRRNPRKKQAIGPSGSAGEAIEKMLQEKRISAKINYDVLKSLSAVKAQTAEDILSTEVIDGDAEAAADAAAEVALKRPISSSPTASTATDVSVTRTAKRARTLPGAVRRGKLKPEPIGLPLVEDEPPPVPQEEKKPDIAESAMEEDFEEDFEDDVPVQEPEMGVMQMLRQHRDDGDDYYGGDGGYGEDEDY